MANREAEFQKKWAKVIAKAWSDPAFKKKLLQNPAAVLAAEGIALPKGLHVEIHENTNKVIHLNLPHKPEGELSIGNLQNIAAGGCLSEHSGQFTQK